jgi:ribokinase
MPLLDVVGLGYCSWDYLGIVDHIPSFDAPTASLKDFAISGGGPVSTALVTLARLGAHVGYLGVLGDDECGQNMKQAFEQEGVDIRHMRVQAGARSSVCIILVHSETGRRSILCYRGNHRELELEEADRPYITSARFLHLDGHHMSAAITAAQWMHQAGGTVVLDANKPRPRLEELLPWVDVLITNSTFPGMYTGQAELNRAAEQFLVNGIKVVVTTLGEEGCAWFTRDRSGHAAGFRVKVVDTTGAGDSFHGAFIYGLLRGWNLERIATFANAVAALNCTALGTRAGLPTLEQVEALISAQRRG